MKNYKTRGLIIKRTNLGEADRIVTIFTEKLGKIKAIAKGIRKINSRLSGNVELFCLTNFTLAEGRNLDIVTGAVIEKCYFEIRNDLPATQQAYYFTELIDKLTEINDPHPEIYHLLDQVLENLMSDNIIIVPYFELNLLSILGYHPELEKCVNCRNKINESENIYFDFNLGGIICEKCNKNQIKLSPNSIKILRLILKHNILTLSKINLDDKYVIEIKRITRTYMNVITEKEFKTQRFVI